MSISAIGSSPTIQWIQQLLMSGAQSALPQSRSSSTSATSDSMSISQEAIQLNATQSTQAQGTDQSTIRGAHHGHHRHGGGQDGQSPLSQLAQDIVNDLQEAGTNGAATNMGNTLTSGASGTNGGSFIQQLANQITANLLAAYGQPTVVTTPPPTTVASQVSAIA